MLGVGADASGAAVDVGAPEGEGASPVMAVADAPAEGGWAASVDVTGGGPAEARSEGFGAAGEASLTTTGR